MGDIAAIRTAIRSALEVDTAAGAVHVYDIMRPGPTLPAVHVGALTSINYHDDYSGGTLLRLTLTLEHARQDPEQAQRWFDTWLSKPGPLTRLEKHPTVAWEQLTVVSASAPRSIGDTDRGEVAALAVDVTIEITT